MEPLVIKKYPEKVLRKNCIQVGEISEREKELFEKMLFTMRYFKGIGLAAPQIGILQKLIPSVILQAVLRQVGDITLK